MTSSSSSPAGGPRPGAAPHLSATARWNPDAAVGSAPPKGMHLRVDGVSHSYGTLRVLTNVSLVVPAGRPTGLLGENGSGKSTLARAVHHRLVEQGDRAVSLLDGDEVRRHLSKGLTFSPEDRDTNIRRIGWVAAEKAIERAQAGQQG